MLTAISLHITYLIKKEKERKRGGSSDVDNLMFDQRTFEKI